MLHQLLSYELSCTLWGFPFVLKSHEPHVPRCGVNMDLKTVIAVDSQIEARFAFTDTMVSLGPCQHLDAIMNIFVNLCSSLYA